MASRVVVEISAQEVADKRQAKERFVLLDVREPWELECAHLGYSDVDVAPWSEILAKGEAALPPPARNRQAEIVVFCHRGQRSLEAALWLTDHGYTNVKSMRGGIAAYALEVDPDVGSY
jgi:adenylyltransferase/sulfurtransferase